MNRSILFPLLSMLACAAFAQEPAKAQDPKKAAKVAEWPTLKQPEQDRVAALAGQFRKPDPALQKSAGEQLAAIGDGAVPILFRQVSDRDEALNTLLFGLFDKMLGPQHAALMARESKTNKPALRRYLVLRMCKLNDPDLEPVLQAATKDKDEDIAFFAQVGLLGLRKTSALAPVLERARTNWADILPLVSQVLPAARSEAMGRATAETIGPAQPPAQAAALRLFRYLGTKEQGALIRQHLQAEDFNVKKEAINAMRAIHGEEPIENLSVFNATKMAKEWASK